MIDNIKTNSLIRSKYYILDDKTDHETKGIKMYKFHSTTKAVLIISLLFTSSMGAANTLDYSMAAMQNNKVTYSQKVRDATQIVWDSTRGNDLTTRIAAVKKARLDNVSPKQQMIILLMETAKKDLTLKDYDTYLSTFMKRLQYLAYLNGGNDIDRDALKATSEEIKTVIDTDFKALEYADSLVKINNDKTVTEFKIEEAEKYLGLSGALGNGIFNGMGSLMGSMQSMARGEVQSMDEINSKRSIGKSLEFSYREGNLIMGNIGPINSKLLKQFEKEAPAPSTQKVSTLTYLEKMQKKDAEKNGGSPEEIAYRKAEQQTIMQINTALDNSIADIFMGKDRDKPKPKVTQEQKIYNIRQENHALIEQFINNNRHNEAMQLRSGTLMGIINEIGHEQTELITSKKQLKKIFAQSVKKYNKARHQQRNLHASGKVSQLIRNKETYSISWKNLTYPIPDPTNSNIQKYGNWGVKDINTNINRGLYIQIGSIKPGIPLTDSVQAALKYYEIPVKHLSGKKTKNGWTRVMLNYGSDSKTKVALDEVRKYIASDAFLYRVK